MSEETNPWLSRLATAPQDPTQQGNPATTPDVAPATGPTTPQSGIAAPPAAERLPITQHRRPATLWVVGVHGGAGESTIASLAPDWSAGDHGWPSVRGDRPARTVLVARTHVRGLQAARSALTQWAAGAVPSVELLGLVLIADAPGRPPRPIRDLAQLVSGGAPRTWWLPWNESWRLDDQLELTAQPRPVRRLVQELIKLTATPTPDPWAQLATQHGHHRLLSPADHPDTQPPDRRSDPFLQKGIHHARP